MLRSCRNTYFSILIDILYSADCLLHHRWTRRSPASSSPIRSAMGKDLGQHSTATLWNKLSRPRSTPLSTGYSVENATFTSAIALTRAPDGMTRGGHGFDHDFLAVCPRPSRADYRTRFRARGAAAAAANALLAPRARLRPAKSWLDRRRGRGCRCACIKERTEMVRK